MYKINACAKYHDANARILSRLVTKGWTIDRWGHAKKEIDGKLYRYKFQHHSVRYERQCVFGATRYCSSHKEWMLVKSLKYSPK